MAEAIVNAYFWEGDRLVIMPDVAGWHFNVTQPFHPVSSRFDREPEFPKYMIGMPEVEAGVRVRFREVFVGGRRVEHPELGAEGPLALFGPDGRVDRIPSAVLASVEHADPAILRGGPDRPRTTALRFRSAARPTRPPSGHFSPAPGDSGAVSAPGRT